VHTQVNTPVSIGNAIRLDNVQLQVEGLGNQLSGTVKGALAGSPVSVNLTLFKGQGVYLKAVSEKPIALDAVLKILFPGDISKAVVIPSIIVLPAMTVTYRSSTGKFSVSTTKEESTKGGTGVHAHCRAVFGSPAPQTCLVDKLTLHMSSTLLHRRSEDLENGNC
jgi:hypothetical protein